MGDYGCSMFGSHTARATIAIFAVASFALPVFASAASVSGLASPTQQLLPLGANTCAALQVQSVNPYVYDNNLDSFDITIADPSYVSVIGSVGDVGIPLSYMRRTLNPDGTLRIHIDIQSMPINGTLPVSLTLLSAPNGKPLCVSVVSFTLTGPATPAKATSVPTPVTTTPAPITATVSTTPDIATSVATETPAVVAGGLQSALTRACEAAGPYQLWFILLALFMVVVGLVAFAEPPLGNRGPKVPLSAILIPLVLLLLFWYLAPACRVAGWIPIVLIVAAAIGLVTAFRDQEMPLRKVAQLPQSTPPTKTTVETEKNTTVSKTIITPPPAPKKN